MKERIVSLDGLKGIACLIIFAYHFLPENGNLLSKIGWHAVAVFCMLAGFTLAYNYKEKIVKEKEYDGVQFFFKRYFKIMPLYWITNGLRYVMFIVSGLVLGVNMFPQDRAYNVGTVVAEFSGFFTGVFTENSPLNGPLWTICCLLLCYILFFAICRGSKGDTFRYTFSWILVLGVSLYSVLIRPDGLFDGKVPFLGARQLKVFAAFAIGCLMFEVYKAISKRTGMLLSAFYLLVFICVVVLSCVNILPKDTLEPIYATAAFLGAPAVLWSVIYLPPIRFIFSNPVFTYLGKISMSIYMWHYLLVDVFVTKKLNLRGSVWGFFVALAVTILVATVSYFLVEPRLQKGMQKVTKSVVK